MAQSLMVSMVDGPGLSGTASISSANVQPCSADALNRFVAEIESPWSKAIMPRSALASMLPVARSACTTLSLFSSVLHL